MQSSWNKSKDINDLILFEFTGNFTFLWKTKKKSEHQRSDDEKEVKETGRGTEALSFCILYIDAMTIRGRGAMSKICPSWLSGLNSVESESFSFNFEGFECVLMIREYCH